MINKSVSNLRASIATARKKSIVKTKRKREISKSVQSPSENSSDFGRSYVTVADIFNFRSEITSGDDQVTLTVDGSDLLNSPAYEPLEEISLVDVFHHESTSFQLASESSYVDLDKDKDNESWVPSEFQLSRTDPTVVENGPTITITLSETKTAILFELNQKVEDVRSNEGQSTIEENERYEQLMQDGGVSRQTVDAESQTIHVHVKTCTTQKSKCPRKNQASYVNNWIMFDSCENPNQEDESLKILKTVSTAAEVELDDETKLKMMLHIYHNTEFREKLKVILRILASNTFEVPQKIYKGLIKEEISNPDVTPTYELQFLWTYTTDLVENRIVSAFSWNPVHPDLMAVGYGPPVKSILHDETGYVLIWCAKNPENPESTFEFEKSISSLDWSTENPSWLAVGFYSGQVQVLDISGQTLTVVKNSPAGLICYKPHWDIHWWDKQNDVEIELMNCDYDDTRIYSTNQDGRILCYSMTKNFQVTEITRLPKVSVLCNDKLQAKKVPIFESSAALILRKHPLIKSHYIVGSEEGYIFHYSDIDSKHSIDRFKAHDGPVYSLEFSHCCPEIFVTSGADWSIRIWCDGITEPLITMRTKYSAVRAALWSPTNSVILATIVEDQICIWNLTRKIYEPMSIIVSPEKKFFNSLKFMADGKQLFASDVDGNVFVFQLKGMPVANYDRSTTLVQALEQALVLKPTLLQQFRDRIYGI